MGRENKKEPKLFYHSLNIEQRVPQDHALRKIAAAVDFSFIRKEVEHLYGVKGNESIDPAVILKLMFLLFYENVKSERALMSQLSYRLDWLWFCGYDFDDTIPNHSVMSKARNRWGAEVFHKFFNNILQQCIKSGLVGGEIIHLDSSLIDANASKDKLQANLQIITDDICGRLDEKTEDKAVKVSPVDPDARLTKKYGKSILGYKDHRSVDNTHGVITATVTTAANEVDGDKLEVLVQEHHKNTGSKPEKTVADRAYGIGKNYRYLRDNKITPCINHKRKNCNCDPEFSNDKFTYDKKRDVFVCPAGHELVFRQRNIKEARTLYQADRKVCQVCPFADKCLSSRKTGRQVQRSFYEDDIQYADSVLSVYERKWLLGRRKHCVEGSFADAANNHGFKRARYRGLEKVTIQNLLIASIQNLRKLLTTIPRRLKNMGEMACILDILVHFFKQNRFLTVNDENRR